MQTNFRPFSRPPSVIVSALNFLFNQFWEKWKKLRPIAYQETWKMSNESQSNVHISMYLYIYMLWVFLSQTRPNTWKKPISRAILMPNVELFININLESTHLDLFTFSKIWLLFPMWMHNPYHLSCVLFWDHRFANEPSSYVQIYLLAVTLSSKTY